MKAVKEGPTKNELREHIAALKYQLDGFQYTFL
jgi:hypothetical protein